MQLGNFEDLSVTRTSRLGLATGKPICAVRVIRACRKANGAFTSAAVCTSTEFPPTRNSDIDVGRE